MGEKCVSTVTYVTMINNYSGSKHHLRWRELTLTLSPLTLTRTLLVGSTRRGRGVLLLAGVALVVSTRGVRALVVIRSAVCILCVLCVLRVLLRCLVV